MEDLSPNEGPMGGRRYTKQELLELSFVPVPANPEAVVALRSMKDKRFEPAKLEELYPQVDKTEDPADEEIDTEDINNEEVKKEDVIKPYANEHACRLKDPDGFEDNSMRSMMRKHKGKEYRVIMGKMKGEDTMTDQAFRYKKDTWTSAEASAHCKSHDGTFEAATETEAEVDVKKDVVEEPPVVVTPIDNPVTPVVPTDDKPVVETPVEEKPIEESPTDKKPDDELSATLNLNKDMVDKAVIPFSDHGMAPESESWDVAGEVANANISDLKQMSTWYNLTDAENKSAYKLQHHKQAGYEAVWRGIAASMAILLGAKGGIDIPEGDRKGVYNHLKKHYAQFNKDIPDYKMVEDQVLSKLGEEVQALTLDREDKHVVRLVKKVIKVQKEQKREAGYTSGQIEKALELLNIALSLYSKDSKDGGETK